MDVKPYLIFNGQAEEALSYYAQLLGAQLENVYRYSDAPANSGMPQVPAEYLPKIMHCCVVRNGVSIFSGADTLPSDPRNFGNRGHMLTIYCDSAAQADQLFAQLAQDAQSIACPMGQTFFATRYAELTDRYGIFWALMYEEEAQ